MLSRARAEVHDNEEVLKIGRPPVLRHPETEIINIYFGLGKTDLFEKDLAKISMITGQIMAFHQSTGKEPEVYVEGHTDSSGSWKTNYEIAHRRARSVSELLIAEGVPSSWIHISDYSEQGLAIPTADGVAEERNRRVEITIIPQS
jgi:outer membrane protein OmpA-like peptidoglycan-associated protein